MKKSLSAASVVMLAVLTAPTAGSATDWVSKWSNGHKIESEEGEFKLKFGGRIQADYTFASADSSITDEFGTDDFQDGFEFRRARFFFSGTIYDKIEFKAQYDFAGGEADFKDVWIALKTKGPKVKFGHFKEPFSLEELTSSKYLAFMERSLPVGAFAPSRNSGIAISGKNGDKFNYGLGYFYDADDFGVSTNEDRTNITGRLTFRPLFEDKGERMLHVGINASQKDTDETFRFRVRPEAHQTTRLVNTDRFEADSATVLGGEIAGVFGPFWFAAEYIQTDVDSPMFNNPTLSGYYAQAGYYLTGEHRRFKTSSGSFDRQKPGDSWDKDGGRGAWEIAARFSSIDLTDGLVAGGEQDNITLALNWYLNPATRWMLNFVRADVDTLGEVDFILTRWQVDF